MRKYILLTYVSSKQGAVETTMMERVARRKAKSTARESEHLQQEDSQSSGRGQAGRGGRGGGCGIGDAGGTMAEDAQRAHHPRIHKPIHKI